MFLPLRMLPLLMVLLVATATTPHAASGYPHVPPKRVTDSAPADQFATPLSSVIIRQKSPPSPAPKLSQGSNASKSSKQQAQASKKRKAGINPVPTPDPVPSSKMTSRYLVWEKIARETAKDPAIKPFKRLFSLLDTGRKSDVYKVADRDGWPNHELLTSYLEYELLFHPLYRSSITELEDFLSRWKSHPYTDRIRWLMDRKVTELGSDTQVIDWFNKRPTRARSMKRRLAAALVAKKKYKEARKLWVAFYRSGDDIPDALKKARKKIDVKLTVSDHDARARAFMADDDTAAFNKQIKKLSKTKQDYLLALKAARQAMGKQFLKHLHKLPNKLQGASELWYARVDGLRNKGFYTPAMTVLTGEADRHLTMKQKRKLRYYLGRLFLFLSSKSGSVRKAHTLFEQNIHGAGATLEDSLWFAGWSAYRLGWKKTALARFKLLGSEAKSRKRRAQGSYWTYRVLKERGAKGGSTWLKRASAFPDTFYGLLALETRLGRFPNLKKQTIDCPDPTGNSRRKKALARDMAHLEALKQVGRGHHNSELITHYGKHYGFSPQEQICLGQRFGAPDRAIRAASILQKRGEVVWQGLYPTPQWRPTGGWTLDQAAVWALGRQESLLNHRVQSPVGALGLLQLMPATAREEAKLINFPKATRHRLQTPAYNLALGQSYLKRMLERFKGDLALSLAAYNAGPHRSDQWKKFRKSDGLVFIENIPFTETRRYVKKVTHGLAIYRWRLRGQSSIKALIQKNRPGMKNLSR